MRGNACDQVFKLFPLSNPPETFSPNGTPTNLNIDKKKKRIGAVKEDYKEAQGTFLWQTNFLVMFFMMLHYLLIIQPLYSLKDKLNVYKLCFKNKKYKLKPLMQLKEISGLRPKIPRKEKTRAYSWLWDSQADHIRGRTGLWGESQCLYDLAGSRFHKGICIRH